MSKLNPQKEDSSFRVVINQNNGNWLFFEHPVQVLQTENHSDVKHLLEVIEEKVAEGFYAAGFLSYEAAPAFDPALTVYECKGFPLLWFGIFKEPDIGPLPSGNPEFHYVSDWEPAMDFSVYQSAINRIKSFIESGDSYQVNYTFRMRSGAVADPWQTFLAVTENNPMPFASYIDTGKHVISSFSPELFFSLDGEHIVTRPMKGTAPRGRFISEDLENARNLYISEKDRAENIMIVDMLRNDLGRIARVNSVEVKDLFRVEKYQSVLQMTSQVSATTDSPVSEIFSALFPCASVTGAPKVRTMEIIKELEKSPRKIYCGSTGYISPNRKAVFSVAIRTLLFDKENNRAEYGTGSGIIWDSDARREYEECLTKAEVIARKSQRFGLIETMRWSPEQGYFLLERHLRRLENSMGYFDFCGDIEKVKQYLFSLAGQFEISPIRVRIEVSRDGRISHTVSPLNKTDKESLLVGIASLPVHSSDRFLFHKTTNRSVFTDAVKACPGFDDILLWNERGEVTETTIGNVVVELEGELFTPAIDCGLLPGTFREELLSRGEIKEAVISVEELRNCNAVYRINSVREWERVVVEGWG
ncbi:MAG: aminodeoxychorismate synthase component I [Fibrobacter sp.]|nr:aminodeoxychorismate synthase component I [Fibrobacter sp.]